MPRRYETIDQVKEALQRFIRRAVDPDIFVHMESKGWVHDVIKDGAPISWLAQEYRDLARLRRAPVSQSPKPPKPPQDIPPNEQIRVLERLVADHAAATQEVRDFRQTHLNGKLLSEREAERWLDQKMRHAAQTGEQDAALRAFHGVAQGLVSRIGWDTNVPNFLLSGEPPPLRRLGWDVRPRQYGPFDLSYVELRVHPSVSPTTVATFYALLLKWLTPTPKATRRRAPKRPASQVVAFVHDRPGQPWEARVTSWNDAHPTMRFSNADHMQRDYTRAKRRAAGAPPRAKLRA